MKPNTSPETRLLQCRWFYFLIIFCTCLCPAKAAETENENARVPYVTGTHLQLVRSFFTAADGLPGDDIRALAVTRDGVVLVATAKGLVRLEGKNWAKEGEPSEVSTLYAPVQGARAFAGAANGVWALNSNGQWQQEEASPSGVIAFSAEPDGTPWAMTASGVWRRGATWTLIQSLKDDVLVDPHGLLPLASNEVFVAAETGLFARAGKRPYWLGLEIRTGGLLSSKARALAWLGQDNFLVATDKGLNLSNSGRSWESFTGSDGLPILDLTHIAVGPEGTVWLGSAQGLIRWKEGTWTYLASKRWLPDNRVTAIAPAPDGSVWIGTPKGLAHIFYQKLTLEQKAAILQRNLESRDRRHGYVTQMHLRAPGVLEGAMQEISDNDGLWTALYVASQSYRYAVTKSPEAKSQAWRSMQALLRLESITGIPGFPARAICQVSERQFGSRSLRSDSEWHQSPVEKDWYWKGETSSDELDGHYFGWQIFYDLAADDEQKRQVAATCKRLTDHILDHGYYLVDKDGQPTTWGFWGPDRLNDDPKYWEERGLGSVEMLSHLKVAMHLVKEPRYEQAYRDLIKKHHYAVNTVRAKLPQGVSHDDQLLFLSYYPLLQLEKDPGLRAIYASSLTRTWDMERGEGNPLWNFIYGASVSGPCDVEAAVVALREIPLDFIQWRAKNSHRADVDPAHPRPLPWTERVVHKWDKDPTHLDDGSDMSEGDQTVWLLPYWMGRYHRLIE